MALPAPSRGLTLVETCIVLAVAAILAAVAWPSQRAQLERARRMDGTLALTRLQIAQEQYRMRHGRYGADLAALGPTRSASCISGIAGWRRRAVGAWRSSVRTR